MDVHIDYRAAVEVDHRNESNGQRASSNVHVLESVDNVGSYLAEEGDRFLIQSLGIANIAPNNTLEGELDSFC